MSMSVTRLIAVLEARAAEMDLARNRMPFADRFRRGTYAGWVAATKSDIELLRALRDEMSDVFPDPEEPFNSLAEKEMAEA